VSLWKERKSVECVLQKRKKGRRVRSEKREVYIRTTALRWKGNEDGNGITREGKFWG
jgi:hypothetical protein